MQLYLIGIGAAWGGQTTGHRVSDLPRFALADPFLWRGYVWPPSEFLDHPALPLPQQISVTILGSPNGGKFEIGRILHLKSEIPKS
jgi:hypothetical protein